MSQEKTILITNDDGIRSLGLVAAANALSDLGRLIIVAPSVQKSGVGRSLSLFEPIRVSSAKVEGHEAYAVAGTPTDAVLIAEYAILKRKPDLLVAGINVGENLSTESVMTSGTLGAALTGASQDIPAIAISLQAHRAHVFEARSEVDFTLLINDMETFAPHYFRALLAKVRVALRPRGLYRGAGRPARGPCGTTTAAMAPMPRSFAAEFFPRLDCASEELMPLLEDFYAHEFEALAQPHRDRPRRAGPGGAWPAARAIRWPSPRSPSFRCAAIQARLRWADVGAEKFPYDFIASYETMSACKPHPRYFRHHPGAAGARSGGVPDGGR